MTTELESAIETNAGGMAPDHDKLVIGILVTIALADRVIDPDELEGIRRGVEGALRVTLTNGEIDGHVRQARARLSAAGGVRFAEQLGRNAAEHGKGHEAVRLAYAIAAISDGISEEEQLHIDALVRGAALPAKAAEKLRAEVLSGAPEVA